MRKLWRAMASSTEGKLLRCDPFQSGERHLFAPMVRRFPAARNLKWSSDHETKSSVRPSNLTVYLLQAAEGFMGAQLLHRTDRCASTYIDTYIHNTRMCMRI